MVRYSVLEEVNAAPVASALSAAEKRALAERVIATKPFSKSERLISFLLHVSHMEASGLSTELSEQHIGQAVFGRPKDYDPSIDGIVRSHASRLRIRLDQYFETDGIDEPIRLTIPRGGYLPRYEARPTTLQEIQPATEVHTSGPGTNRLDPLVLDAPRRSPRILWWAAALVAVFLTAVVLFRVDPGSRLATLFATHSPSDELWDSLFVPGRETTLVVGDGGVNMFQNMARRQLSPEEYSSRSWLNEPLAQTPQGYSWAPIAVRHYTPWFVVGFATRLARLPAVHDGQFKSMSARELSLNALKNDQLILVDGPEYDPWEQLLWSRHNFHVSYDGVENSISIVNQQPRAGELAVYKWSQADTVSHTGYSLISLGKNLNDNGRILELEGSTAQGDEAAAEFILDHTKMDPFLRKALKNDGQIADFEMVLRTNFVAGGNTDSHIVAYRIYQ